MTDAPNNISSYPDENIYKVLFDTYSYPVVIARTDGEILDMNPTACRILGVERGDTLTKRVEEFFRWNANNGNKPPVDFNDFVLNNTNGEAKIQNANGSLRCISYRLQKIPIKSGELIMIWFREIAESEAMERRTKEQAKTLSEVAAILNSSLELGKVLQLILEQLEKVVEYDSASIMLINGEAISIAAQHKFRSEIQMLSPLNLKKMQHVQAVLETRQSIIIADTRKDARWLKLEEASYIRCWLGVPLIVHGQVIGLLNLDKEQVNFYQMQDAQIAEAFANHAAIAIENARLYTQEKRQVEEASVLRDTLTDLSSELELPRLLQAILERATSLLNAAGGQLGLYEADQNEIVIVAAHNMGRDYIGKRIRIGEGATGLVAKNRSPIIVDDYLHWDNHSPNYANANWHAVIGAPMMIAKRLVGVITIGDQNPNRVFGQDEERLLYLLTQQAAIAVENARLYQSVKLAADRRLVLHKVSQAIVATKVDAEAIYKAIHQAAEQLMSTEAFVICMDNPSKECIEAVYLTDRSGRAKNQVFSAGKGMSGYVIANGKSLIIHDMLEEEQNARQDGLEFIHFGSPEAIRSILMVPMWLGGEVIGAISAQSYQPHVYNEEDLALLEMLASYAAIALENSHLFNKIQRLAITDSLTDIYNRRHLFVLGQREFNRARRFKRPLSVIFIDIDHFKKINDHYGHRAGDQALILIARTIQDHIRDIDVVGRYGGEEFLLFIPEVDLNASRYIAERIRTSVEQALRKSLYSKPPVTISLGVVELTDDTPSLSALVARADAAMYDAKRRGRNRVAVR
jgi:diguanylate cyclase (GGDEF)-like protein